MKKFIYIILAMVLMITSCQDNKEEYLFGENINSRFEKLKSEYVETLTSAENGWIGYYNPNDKVGGFIVLMKFDKDGYVTMASDYNEGQNDNKTTYRIDKRLKVELIFESHAVLHQIYETNKNGVDGEYTFNIKSATKDEVVLESATDFGYNGSGVTELKLKKATAEHWNFDGVYETTPKLANGYKTSKYFRSIYVEGTEVKGSFSYVDGYSNTEINRYSIIKKFNSEGTVDTENIPMAVTNDGFKFLKPYVINGKEVTDFKYDEENNRFVSKDGGQTTIIEHTNEPPVLYFPSVSMGEDGKLASQLYSHSYYWPTVKLQSSVLFKRFVYTPSKTKRFDIYLNSDYDGQLPQKEEVVIRVINRYGRYIIPCTVERIKNERIIFKIKGDLKDYGKGGFYKRLGIKYVKKLTDLLTSSKGFYVEETEQKTLFGKYKGYIYISVDNPQVRFSTLRY